MKFRTLSFALLIALFVGCAAKLYRVEVDPKGREHCRNTNTGVYVNMVNCE